MTDLEFMEVVQSHYRSELERTKNPRLAHKSAERFRVSLRLSEARAALAKKEKGV